MDLNKLAAEEFEWIERMNWHNKTVLEQVGMAGAEIGEAAEEAIAENREAFGEEMADVFLNVSDIAHARKIDLNKLMENTSVTWRTKNVREDFAEVMVEYAKWVNTARKATLDESFDIALGRVLRRIFDIADREGIDMEYEIKRKMEINEKRGNRHRLM